MNPLTIKYDINECRANKITQNLLGWYDENKRSLPWRDCPDPYAIWVSEIMAQQTRISVLVSFYERFMKQFPTVESLANAGEDQVLKAWEGLGYYSRARNLRLAAQKVVSDFNGTVPGTKEELISLPGIGEYTAGAILSIAFNIPAPAVDGNVLRVFSRLENSEEDITIPRAKMHAKQFVTAIMSKKRTSCFTQALMELGALVCIPQNPLCDRCPLVLLCKAYKYNTQKEIPKKSAKKPQKSMNKTILIICNADGQILMRQRTEKLLNGLWEFYMLDDFIDLSEIYAHLGMLGYTVSDIAPLGRSKHVFTHIIWNMQGFYCCVSGNDLPEGYSFYDKSSVKNLAIPSAIRFFAESML